ncbi:MAG: formyltransferase family protein [Polaribacter sp.]
MNIALITNKDLHHKYWAYTLYTKHNVKLVIHPQEKLDKNITKIIKKKRLLMYGFFWFFLKGLSIIYNKFSSIGLNKIIEKNEKKYFQKYGELYDKIPQNIVHNVETVNSDICLKLIKDNHIDVICFLGGDIAKSKIINSVKLCLNYHSGISPFYNGNKTIMRAVGDFRPNFAGGTLMKMNERIDGGKILKHYLMPILKEDTYGDLFMKGIIGAEKVYDLVLNKLIQGEVLKGIKQQRTFKYVRNVDWIITDDIKLRYFIKNNRMKSYVREEKILDYTEETDLDKIFVNTLSEILVFSNDKSNNKN